jgi:hypothetical protein
LQADNSLTGIGSEEVSQRLSQVIAVFGGKVLILLILGYWQDVLFGIAVRAILAIWVYR